MNRLTCVVLIASCAGAFATTASLRLPGDSHLTLLGSDVRTVAERAEGISAPREFLAPRTADDQANTVASYIEAEHAPSKIAKFYHTSGPWLRYVMDSLVSWLIWVVLMMLIWMTCYPDDLDVNAIFAESHPDPVKTFTSGHFGCLKTPQICICAMLCPALRWADTIDMTGLKRISGALSLFFLFGLLNCLVYCTFTYGVCTCFLILYYRHKIRALLGLPNWTCKSCCVDFFYVFLCPFCAIAQEARVVRQGCQIPTNPTRIHLPSLKTEAPSYMPRLSENMELEHAPPGAPPTYHGLPDAVLKRIVY